MHECENKEVGKVWQNADSTAARDAIPHVFGKCAQAIECNGDNENLSAAVCVKCAEAIENIEFAARIRVSLKKAVRRQDEGVGKVGSRISNGARLHSSEYHESFTMSINIF